MGSWSVGSVGFEQDVEIVVPEVIGANTRERQLDDGGGVDSTLTLALSGWSGDNATLQRGQPPSVGDIMVCSAAHNPRAGTALQGITTSPSLTFLASQAGISGFERPHVYAWWATVTQPMIDDGIDFTPDTLTGNFESLVVCAQFFRGVSSVSVLGQGSYDTGGAAWDGSGSGFDSPTFSLADTSRLVGAIAWSGIDNDGRGPSGFVSRATSFATNKAGGGLGYSGGGVTSAWFDWSPSGTVDSGGAGIALEVAGA